ncbi:cytochrome P450 [Favolaschia claudopus]|uniref:Cytochrome P450 n=1 Tax=Favolaschia claudopus TaxID=2862362 RepID=A0AAV9ZHV9_9AGAR
MSLPPGIRYLLNLLPTLLTPPFTVYFAKWFAETYLNLQISRMLVVPLCFFSFPIVFTARVQYSLWKDRRAAASHGAVLPSTIPAWWGGIDLLIAAVKTQASQYPGEGLAILAKSLGNIYNLRILFKDMFFTFEPEHVKIILATEANSFEKGEDLRVIFQPLLGSGIFSVDGDLWKFHRAMTRPFFTRERFSDYELFDRHSLEAINVMKNRLREGHPIDFQDLVARFGLDSSSEFLFGKNPRTLTAGLPYPPNASSPSTSNTTSSSDRSNTFGHALDLAQHISIERGAAGALWPLTEIWRDRIAEPMRVVHEFLDPILSEAVSRRAGAAADSDAEKFGDEDGKKEIKDRQVQEGETLVDHLLHYTQDRTILRDEILNISMAGRDTNACLLTFLVYMLTSHSHVQTKLREEILNAVGPSRAPTPEDFRDMKYLRAVINETLRLYAPVAINFRSSTKPVLLPSMTPGGKPYYVPANTKVAYSVLVMHRRKDLWGPDALEWDPDRFIDERLHKYLTPNPFIFLPFNAGPRICLGQQFAYHEASFFLVRLLQSFSDIALAQSVAPVSPSPSHPSAEPDPLGWKQRERLPIRMHLTLYLKGGLWVNMTETDDNSVVD